MVVKAAGALRVNVIRQESKTIGAGGYDMAVDDFIEDMSEMFCISKVNTNTGVNNNVESTQTLAGINMKTLRQ